MGRPRKIQPEVEYVEDPDMPPLRISYLKDDGHGGWSESRAAVTKPVRALKPRYELGQVFKSSGGHEATVVGVSDMEITFGFTRAFKGETETRQRSVPLGRVDFFLKAYRG